MGYLKAMEKNPWKEYDWNMKGFKNCEKWLCSAEWQFTSSIVEISE